jgi:hypothetical protein
VGKRGGEDLPEAALSSFAFQTQRSPVNDNVDKLLRPRWSGESPEDAKLR